MRRELIQSPSKHYTFLVLSILNKNVTMDLYYIIIIIRWSRGSELEWSGVEQGELELEVTATSTSTSFSRVIMIIIMIMI